MNLLGQPNSTSGPTLPAEGLTALEMIIDPKNANILNHTRSVTHKSRCLGVIHSGFRAKLRATKDATIGKVNITNAPHSVCKLFAVLGVVSVIALVLKIPAPKRATPINKSHHRPIMPPMVCKEGQSAVSRASTLPPQQKNASDMSQP